MVSRAIAACNTLQQLQAFHCTITALELHAIIARETTA